MLLLLSNFWRLSISFSHDNKMHIHFWMEPRFTRILIHIFHKNLCYLFTLTHERRKQGYVALQHAMERWSKALHIPSLGVTSFNSSSALYMVLPLDKRLYGPKSRSGRGSEEKSLPQPGIELRSSKPHPVTFMCYAGCHTPEGNLSGKSVFVTVDLISILKEISSWRDKSFRSAVLRG
jgi:hypothetical protein